MSTTRRAGEGWRQRGISPRRRGRAAMAGLLLLGCLPLLASACAGGPRGRGVRGISGGQEEPEGEKSALLGTVLAIFPGLLVHGMGHRYAGNSEKANEILTMEGYSLLTAGLGGGLYAIGDARDADAVKVAGWVGISAGGAAFLGSWIYDIVFTPSEVKRYNRSLREAK